MKANFLKALEDKETGLFPIWIMRQAGRYLPSYQSFRRKYPLQKLFKEPKLACKVMLLPFQDLSLDAAIIFSDITLALEQMGCEVTFLDKKGPYVLFSKKKTGKAFSYVQETLERARPFLSVPILGFCGAPFTVFCYFLNDRYPFQKTKIFIRENPKKAKEYLERITEACILFLQSQIEKKVEAVQVFESHLDVLSFSLWEEFSFPFLQKLCKTISISFILYAPSCLGKIEKISSLHPSAISVDSTLSLKEYRKNIPKSISLQGNFAVEDLFLNFSEIEQKVEKMVSAMRQEPGYIVNLGQGIWPNVAFPSVQHFVRMVKKYALQKPSPKGKTLLSTGV